MRLAMLGVVSMLAVLVPAKAADAENQHLSLGEIAVVQPARAHMTSSLRSALQSEMRDLDLRSAHKDAIMSVSLVTLDTDRGQATCVISATLRSRDGGVLFAVLEGRARAQGSSDHISESAMRGAVHGALSRVVDALK